MAAGRAPALTARGKLVLAVAAALGLAGAASGAWALAALGVLEVGLLGAAYVAFFPAAVLIWRRHVELTWGVRGELVAGRPFALHVTLRNRGPARLGRAQVRVIASSAIETPALDLYLGAREETAQVAEGRARAAGLWFL